MENFILFQSRHNGVGQGMNFTKWACFFFHESWGKHKEKGEEEEEKEENVVI